MPLNDIPAFVARVLRCQPETANEEAYLAAAKELLRLMQNVAKESFADEASMRREYAEVQLDLQSKYDTDTAGLHRQIGQLKYDLDDMRRQRDLAQKELAALMETDALRAKIVALGREGDLAASVILFVNLWCDLVAELYRIVFVRS